ncbi:hypothetical protein IWW54_004357, partial [Coemansia sp. RSA 2705]
MADWQIRVKALLVGGVEKEFQIGTQSDETIGAFREKLADQSHIASSKQRLIFRGQLLRDNTRKMGDAGLRDGCALHMVEQPSNAGSQASAGSQPGAADPAPDTDADRTWRRLPSMFAPPSAEHVQRTIRDVYRNFGADDGGEWMAASAGGQYFRIDREAAPGSQLTREEFARGPIRAPNPVSSSSSMAAYEPLPGV